MTQILHTTAMAEALIERLHTLDPKAKLIGGFGRRKGLQSVTTSDIDVELSIDRTGWTTRRLKALLRPRKVTDNDWWVNKNNTYGLYFHRTELYGNVDLFFPGWH